MRVRDLNSLALILVVAGFTACSGGGGSGSSTGAAQNCADDAASALCLTACNLGCTLVGCELTEIAQNQPLIFTFSQDIDPLSVNTASISLKTAQGEEPVGRYIVNGSTVTFLPEVRTVGGTTFFGFDPSAKYTLQMPGGPNNINALVSTSGDRLQQSFNCTVSVSLGVLDLDGLPPSADLLAPKVRDDVSRDLLIVLEFSEIIDVAPFFGTNAATGPVRFLLRRTVPLLDPITGEPIEVNGRPQFECNTISSPTALFGAPRVQLDSVRGLTIVTYRSPQLLPGDKCVEIVVTDRVRDLAGTPARLQVFRLITQEHRLDEFDIIEDFKDETNLDRDLSSGSWSDAVDPDGEATFGSIGGAGTHGEFSLKLARQVLGETIDGKEFSVFEFDTDRTVIPGTNTIDGRNIEVTDGVFSFSKFVLPRLTKLRFVGSRAPQFTVRGLVDIDGIIDLHGRSVMGGDESPSIAELNEIGQPGGTAGAGGGDGGAGGDKPDGLGLQQRFNGQDGGAGSVVAGHAYMSTAVNSGGKGSVMQPPDGLRSSISYTGFQTGMVAAGGGGGGHVNPGGNGMALRTNPSGPGDLGPEGEGGEGYPDLLPVPPGSLSHEHFLIGGGGGGGGGGHPLFAFSAVKWRSSAGGAGGGGAILLRAGHRLRLGPDSAFDVSGGSAGDFEQIVGFGPPSPGGGGSGGAIVLQGANADRVEVAGRLDVRAGNGGTGKTLALQPTSPPQVDLVGGDGSHGLVRLETPSPQPTLSTVLPPEAASTGDLVEIDNLVAFQSGWFDTGEFFPPEFMNYELEVEVGGMPMTFSDDQTLFPGSLLAGEGQPIVFRIQGAVLDLFTGEPDPLSIRPWRFFVGEQGATSGQLGLIDDAATGFRFLIVLDRGVMGPAVEVVIKKLTIHYEA